MASVETDPQNYYTLASLLSSMAYEFLSRPLFSRASKNGPKLKRIAELLLQAKSQLGQGPFLAMIHENGVYVDESFIGELEHYAQVRLLRQ